MVNAEIKEMLARKNDVVTRAVDFFGLMNSEKNLETIRAELDNVQKTLAEKRDVKSDG